MKNDSVGPRLVFKGSLLEQKISTLTLEQLQCLKAFVKVSPIFDMGPELPGGDSFTADELRCIDERIKLLSGGGEQDEI